MCSVEWVLVVLWNVMECSLKLTVVLIKLVLIELVSGQSPFTVSCDRFHLL